MGYLDVDDDAAHEGAEDPGVGDVPDDGWRRAEEHHQDVGQRQVHDEDVGHALHRARWIDRACEQWLHGLLNIVL